MGTLHSSQDERDKTMRLVFSLLITLLLQNNSFAATCSIPSGLNLEESGDARYSKIMMCDQYYIDKFWDDFNMVKYEWNDGFGYYDVCNAKLPLGRVMNAIFALHITKTVRHPKSILNWAYDYAESNISILSARCGDGRLNARNILSKVTFFFTGLYDDSSVVRRAGILLHESRHTLKIHNGGDRCISGKSCDSSWGYYGANQYHVLWLWWFGRKSRATTEALRNDALREARWRHDERFVLNPGKNI